MATTMRLIGKQTLGASAASVTFNDIPSNYSDLLIQASARTTKTGAAFANVKLEFNGSTTGYSDRTLYTVTGNTVASSTDSVLYAIQAAVADDTANTFGNSEAYIPNYAGSTAKSVSGFGVNENNGTPVCIILYAGLWTGTSAITSLTLTPDSGSFISGSSFFLYGITRA